MARARASAVPGHRRRSAHRHRLIAVAVIALMAMACGDDTDGTTATTTSESVATTTSIASATTTTTPPPSSTSAVSITSTTSTPPSSSTTSPAVTLGEVVASIERDVAEQHPDPPHARIVCDEPADMIVHRGTVLYCDTEMPPGYEEGTWLIVITDDSGTAAYYAATDFSGDQYGRLGPGLLCRDLLAMEWFGDQRTAINYLFLLAYWFQDGQPDRMDADLDGIPCETLFAPAVVETVWAGGLMTLS